MSPSAIVEALLDDPDDYVDPKLYITNAAIPAHYRPVEQGFYALKIGDYRIAVKALVDGSGNFAVFLETRSKYAPQIWKALDIRTVTRRELPEMLKSSEHFLREPFPRGDMKLPKMGTPGNMSV